MRSRPVGVTIIAIVLVISGIGQVIAGLEGMDILRLDLGGAEGSGSAAGAGAIISGVLTLIVAYGMFTLAGWAWLVTIIVMILRILADAFVVIEEGLNTTVGYAAVANIVVSAIILWYFYRPYVRAAFGN